MALIITQPDSSSTDEASIPSPLNRYRAVRAQTARLCEPLALEDYVIQSMPDASPTRWHIAHTTWFFETFFLAKAIHRYRPYRPEYSYLFNSYYNAVGEQFPRPDRGVLSRPTVGEIMEYRAYVDRQMETLLKTMGINIDPALAEILVIGLNHEQQHQELMLTDIKHAFSLNPLEPAYVDRVIIKRDEPAMSLGWVPFEEGVREIGHSGDGFCFDNERPRHRVFLEPFELSNRLVTNADFLHFIEDGGYERPALWLSEGWTQVEEHGWRAPLYWRKRDGGWRQFSLLGLRPLVDAEPVSHVSFFEADAFARWADARLPTEVEWEVSSELASIEGNFADSGILHAQPAAPAEASACPIHQMFGDLWEWTASQYLPYPGYRPPEGAIGEYNGKFMCNQFVLRGGSCATPRGHIRRTYRNFFPPAARWQFSGFRLARSR